MLFYVFVYNKKEKKKKKKKKEEETTKLKRCTKDSNFKNEVLSFPYYFIFLSNPADANPTNHNSIKIS